MYKNAFFLILVSFKKSMMALLFIIISLALLIVYILTTQIMVYAFIFLAAMLLLLHFSTSRIFINYYCFKVIINEVVEPYYNENKQELVKEEFKEKSQPDKYSESSNITEKSEYIYENGKLIKREIAETESVFEDKIKEE